MQPIVSSSGNCWHPLEHLFELDHWQLGKKAIKNVSMHTQIVFNRYRVFLLSHGKVPDAYLDHRKQIQLLIIIRYCQFNFPLTVHKNVLFMLSFSYCYHFDIGQKWPNLAACNVFKKFIHDWFLPIRNNRCLDLTINAAFDTRNKISRASLKNEKMKKLTLNLLVNIEEKVGKMSF